MEKQEEVRTRFLKKKKKKKVELPHDPAVPLLGIHQKKLYFEKIHAPIGSQQHYLQQSRHETTQ